MPTSPAHPVPTVLVDVNDETAWICLYDIGRYALLACVAAHAFSAELDFMHPAHIQLYMCVCMYTMRRTLKGNVAGYRTYRHLYSRAQNIDHSLAGYLSAMIPRVFFSFKRKIPSTKLRCYISGFQYRYVLTFKNLRKNIDHVNEGCIDSEK